MKGGLGRGLESIFVENAAENAPGGATTLRLSEIEPRAAQPRKRFDESALLSLAESIRENGVIQPVAVRRGENGFYELVAGERRWRAAKLAGLGEIPAVILDIDDRKTAELALIENVQREDLTPTEVALGYKTLMEEYGLTQEGVAHTVGKSRPAVANALRLLELPASVAAMLDEGAISEGHAKVLLAVKDEATAKALADCIVEKGLSVRATEALVKKTLRDAARAVSEDSEDEPDGALPHIDYRELLEKKATERLGRSAKIVAEKNGRGSLLLSYEDEKDLENLLTALCGRELFEDF